MVFEDVLGYSKANLLLRKEVMEEMKAMLEKYAVKRRYIK